MNVLTKEENRGPSDRLFKQTVTTLEGAMTILWSPKLIAGE
jgi:hypothetical protein